MLVESARSVLYSATAVLADGKEEFDPNTVTPGVWGFVVTFLVMVAVVLLVLDMVRRIRRTNYRAQVRAQIDAENEAAARDAELGSFDEGDGPDASGTAPDGGDRPAG